MINAWIYSLRNGQILRNFFGPDDLLPLNVHEGEGWVARNADEETEDTHYVKDGVVVPREPLEVKVSVSGMEATVTGVPAGSMVLWDGMEGEADQGELVVDHDEPGTYRLIIRSTGHLELTKEITLG